MKINIYKTENQSKTRWKFTLEEPRCDNCGKRGNSRARNGGAGKRDAVKVAGAAWLEARRDGGSITLVDEEEGLAWWWSVAGTVAERETLSNQSNNWPE